MSEETKSATNYHGFIILEVVIVSGVGGIRSTMWRVTDGNSEDFIFATSKQAAETKIDNGEAKKELEILRAKKR